MDIDVFASARAGGWQRLEQLAGTRRLTGAQADELVRLYRQGATHLSLLRTNAPDPELVSRLSVILVKARSRIASPHDLTWSQVLSFFTRTIPAALYRVRWWSVITAVLGVLVAVSAGWWTASHPALLASVVPPTEQREIAESAFASYYSEYPSASFSAMVWTNNAFVAALCVATGITGIYPAKVMFDNALNVGVMGAVMHVQNADWVFWSLILPHGLLELSCVFVAGAAGMRLAWAWLVPGHRTRRQSLAEEGRTTIVVVVALTIALFISGLIEGFVTGSQLDPWLKIGIGGLAFVGFWVVVFGLGRRAVRIGTDPGLNAEEQASLIPVAG
ncbi:putative membrane protein SpoIIM required for sporulation [Propionicimonas paludicola]|uniref:Putative membrane protein SpoIIM required for sporulation n=1 Tax=Propionicimonas paludicola TaxID=185243 RepID=A0A2A9CT97_9ACTN|nr:stage II sporulation protein M [Propionicimonas paludicola]PFG17667.1 putative membrane protein SpoIIM required for sporulation [Propionicimonas paludicola]